jgi:hypothetical protein
MASLKLFKPTTTAKIGNIFTDFPSKNQGIKKNHTNNLTPAEHSS